MVNEPVRIRDLAGARPELAPLLKEIVELSLEIGIATASSATQGGENIVEKSCIDEVLASNSRRVVDEVGRYSSCAKG